MADIERRAVVIGAASGMGRAAALRLHRDGYRLILADLRLDTLADLASRLDAQAFAVDVVDRGALDGLAASCGDIDALVQTAGLSMSMAPFARILEVNLGGTAAALAAFAPRLRPGSAVVCLASIAGHLAGPLDPALDAALDAPLDPDLASRAAAALPAEMVVPGMAYTLSKLGVLRLVQREAAAFGARSVRLCSISPGVIETPMGVLERDANPQAQGAVGLGPIPRLGTAEEVANVIAFLCSNEASYITGSDILVDGGWVGTIRTSPPDSPFAEALAAGRAKS